MRYVAVLLPIVVALVASPAWAQAVPAPRAAPPSQDLKQLTIEELTEVDVTTASRRVERLSQTAAAITVILQEDIRRAGVNTLPEALRLATGVHAAQAFGSGWAISARGFNISTANKLLVLIDGRTVYSPVFSGVFWESQDVLLADVDRIEVIRGPGGALWGANAVNGVINVITKPAAETQGTLVQVAAGTESRGLAAVRHGGAMGTGSYRVYGQFRAEDDRELVSGGSAQDDLQFGQAGFRMESGPAGRTRWLLQGDVFSARSGLADRSDVRMSGGNVLSRVAHQFSPDSQFQLLAYYDRTYRRVPLQYEGTRDTVDIDTQQRLHIANRHELVFGAGARVSRGDDNGDGPGFFFEPQLRTSTLFSAFAQDEFSLLNERLFLTLGTKVERNDFSGVEWQPTARLRWSRDLHHTLWGAVSRAVRMPTRFDTDLRIRLPGASGRLLLTGSDRFASENVIAYEGGYRIRPRAWLGVDVAVFANRYSDVRSQELPTQPGNPIVLANTLNARTSGTEVSASAQVMSRWQLHGSYSYLWERFGRDAESRDVTGGTSEANDPSHLALLRSYVDLGHATELDAVFRFVSALPAPAVARYAELNVRFGWRLRSALDLSIVGQNLLHDHHEEFAAGTPREFVLRGVQVRATWQY